MKRIVLITLIIVAGNFLYAQNVGIGTSNPQQKLEVNGAIKVGGTSGAAVAAGTIQWNVEKNDFEGFNGTNWVSLTGGKGSWGNPFSLATENSTISHRLYYTDVTGNTVWGRFLGQTLGMKGDWLLAGVPGDLNEFDGFQGAGNIRFFKKYSSGWKYEKVLISPHPGQGKNFGMSMKVSGDHLIVGEPHATNSTGRAYIFTLNANSDATLQADLLAPDAESSDNFGYSVAMWGTLAAVGAPFKKVGSNNMAGKVYLYRRNTVSNIWFPLPAITAPDNAIDANFGRTISMDQEYMAIAAPGMVVNGVWDRGKVYLYHYNGSTWSLATSFTSPQDVGRELFGESLFLKGDTLVVGASQFINDPDNGNGRVYVYIRNGNDWTWQATLTAADGKRNDAFGSAVYLHNGHIAVGASRAKTNNVQSAGRVYVFRWSGTSWVQQAALTASDAQETMNGYRLGTSLIMTDNTVIAGAPSATDGSSEENGRLYLFNK